MSDEQASPKPTPEDVVKRRVEQAQQMGFQTFLALCVAGRDITAKDMQRALLGLGKIHNAHVEEDERNLRLVSEQLGGRVRSVAEQTSDRFRTVGAMLDEAQKQIAHAMVRQEVLMENVTRVYRLAVAEHVFRERLEEWRALSWWARRKAPRPEPPDPAAYGPVEMPRPLEPEDVRGVPGEEGSTAGAPTASVPEPQPVPPPGTIPGPMPTAQGEPQAAQAAPQAPAEGPAESVPELAASEPPAARQEAPPVQAVAGG